MVHPAYRKRHLSSRAVHGYSNVHTHNQNSTCEKTDDEKTSPKSEAKRQRIDENTAKNKSTKNNEADARSFETPEAMRQRLNQVKKRKHSSQVADSHRTGKSANGENDDEETSPNPEAKRQRIDKNGSKEKASTPPIYIKDEEEEQCIL